MSIFFELNLRNLLYVIAILDIIRKGVVLSITRENFYVREEVSLSSTFRKILLTYCSQSQENQ